MSPTHVHTSTRRAAAVLALTLAATTGACGDKSKHATDGDTGAAAPATVKDMSATPQAGDSTKGVSNPTGQPSSAGDTSGARARDSSPGAKGGSPVGGASGATPGRSGARP
jgi:hypothetical protein